MELGIEEWTTNLEVDLGRQDWTTRANPQTQLHYNQAQQHQKKKMDWTTRAKSVVEGTMHHHVLDAHKAMGNCSYC